MLVADSTRTAIDAPVEETPFIRRRPYLFIFLGSVLFSLLNLMNDSPFLDSAEIEWHDTVSQWFIIAIMLGWVAITHRSQVETQTYNRFFFGSACLIWLMTIKFFGELYDTQTSVLTVFELLLAVVGLLLVTFGLLSWSKEFQRAIDSLSISTSRYRELSEKDPLTGLLNRGQFDEIANHLVDFDRSLSLVLVDLDKFKSINDTHGHPVGDRVIQRSAEILSDHLRGSDYAFRMGGEEFALLYVGCPQALVAERAETIREALAGEAFTAEDQQTFTVTASLGVAHLENNEDPSSLYRRADDALYEAKSLGRARVVVATSL